MTIPGSDASVPERAPEEPPSLIALQEARECLLRRARDYLALAGVSNATIAGEVAAGFYIEMVVAKRDGSALSLRPAGSEEVHRLPCL